jgi:hypothetical protein
LDILGSPAGDFLLSLDALHSASMSTLLKNKAAHGQGKNYIAHKSATVRGYFDAKNLCLNQPHFGNCRRLAHLMPMNSNVDVKGFLSNELHGHYT